MCEVNPEGPERIEHVGKLPEKLSKANWRGLVSLGGWSSVYSVMFGVRLLRGGV